MLRRSWSWSTNVHIMAYRLTTPSHCWTHVDSSPTKFCGIHLTKNYRNRSGYQFIKWCWELHVLRAATYPRDQWVLGTSCKSINKPSQNNKVLFEIRSTYIGIICTKLCMAFQFSFKSKEMTNLIEAYCVPPAIGRFPSQGTSDGEQWGFWSSICCKTAEISIISDALTLQ